MRRTISVKQAWTAIIDMSTRSEGSGVAGMFNTRGLSSIAYLMEYALAWRIREEVGSR